MEKTKRWLRKLTKNKYPFFIILFLSFCFVLNFITSKPGHWATQSLISTDSATILLGAAAHNMGLGIPYKDYWIYHPPGFLMILDFWYKIFGVEVLAYKLLEFIFRLSSGVLLFTISRKLFPFYISILISCITSVALFSPFFGTMMLADPYGLPFSLLGLFFLLYSKDFKKKFFLSGLFFAISSQIREPMFFTSFSVIPVFFSYFILKDYKKLIKAIIYFISGFIIILFVAILYLLSINAIFPFIEMQNFKSHNYSIIFWTDIKYFLQKYYHSFWLVRNLLSSTKVPISLFVAGWIILKIKNKVRLKIKNGKNAEIIFYPLSIIFSDSLASKLIFLFYAVGAYF